MASISRTSDQVRIDLEIGKMAFGRKTVRALLDELDAERFRLSAIEAMLIEEDDTQEIDLNEKF